MPEPLLCWTPSGLFCPVGQFFIDPSRPVAQAVITHAHADHARPGSRNYLTVTEGEHVLRTRLGPGGTLETVPYGEPRVINGVRLSLHPAGHMLGSCQVRVEHQGEVWVFSGDYKIAADPTCAAYEPLRCHTFITEATFAQPMYSWPDQSELWPQIIDWWQVNRAWNRASVIYSYALGKAQRILAGLRDFQGKLLTQAFVETATRDYRRSGIDLPPTYSVDDLPDSTDWKQGIVIAPPGARGGKWMRRLGPVSTAFASGWMTHTGACQRHRVDQGFVLSDHADWNEILTAVKETGAERILVTHGAIQTLVQELNRRGYQAAPLNPQERESGFRPLPPAPQLNQKRLF